MISVISFVFMLKFIISCASSLEYVNEDKLNSSESSSPRKNYSSSLELESFRLSEVNFTTEQLSLDPINSTTPIDVQEMLNSSLNLEPFNNVEERFARKRRSSERKARSPHTLLELLGLDTKKEDAIKSYNGDKFGFDALLSGMFPMRRSIPESAEFCEPFLEGLI